MGAKYIQFRDRRLKAFSTRVLILPFVYFIVFCRLWSPLGTSWEPPLVSWCFLWRYLGSKTLKNHRFLKVFEKAMVGCLLLMMVLLGASKLLREQIWCQNGVLKRVANVVKKVFKKRFWGRLWGLVKIWCCSMFGFFCVLFWGPFWIPFWTP